MNSLLQEKGLAFTLPELARESGVATATVYRHFDDLHDLRERFYERVLDDIVEALRPLPEQYQGLELFETMCRTWVECMWPFARAATFIRAAVGFLERVRDGDRLTSALHHEILSPVVDRLIADGVIPEQDRDYAVLVWITMFDERVLVDLDSALGWSLDDIIGHLSASVLAALQHPVPTARPARRARPAAARR